MIEVAGLTKHYGLKAAIEDVNFSINEGEVVGFLGPNGAGKTTTMNILTGFLSATSGVARINGIDVLENPIDAKKQVGYLPEHPPLYLDMTVKAYLNFVFDLKKVKFPRNSHIAEVCGLVKIEDVFERVIKNLSKGYRQRVGLAAALIGNPKVLILDEPTVGLDPKQIIEIRNLIKQLGKGHTVILSSHILPEVQAVCERIIVINRGKIVADDTPENLTKTTSTDHKIVVRIAGREREILSMLKALPDVRNIYSLGQKEDGCYDFTIESKEGRDVREPLFRELAERKWPLMGLKRNEMTLEDVFLRLTSGMVTKKEEVGEK